MSKSHDTVPVSLLDDLALAVQRIFQHAHREASSRNEELSDEECLRVAAGMRAHFDCAIAAELHERNAERISRLRLPGELWVEIWSHLPMRDVVTATHVCRMWRSLALASPSLWSTLEVFNTRHHEKCECEACMGIREWDLTCKGCRRPVVPGNANTELLRHLLPRSKSSALSCFVDTEDPSDVDQTVQLAKILLSHHQRLVHLYWRSGTESLALFLSHFDALPALRSLTTGVRYSCPKFSRNIQLPSLQQLMVAGSPCRDDYDHDSGRLAFPSVTRLVYRLSTSNLSAFVHTLEMFPNIRILDLRAHISMDSEAASRDYGRLAELAVHVTHIRIHAMDNMYGTIVALHTPQRRSFIVELPWSQLPEGSLCSIFSDLRQGVRLSITCSRHYESARFPYWDIDGTDCQGMHRGLYQCRGNTVQTLWDHHPPLSFSEISIDVALLGGVVGTHSVFSGVHELTISITDVDAFAFPETGSTPHFPDLRLLRLTVTKSLSMLFISASSLAPFISDLRIDGGVLAELVLENATMEGGIAEVAAVVHEH